LLGALVGAVVGGLLVGKLAGFFADKCAKRFEYAFGMSPAQRCIVQLEEFFPMDPKTKDLVLRATCDSFRDTFTKRRLDSKGVNGNLLRIKAGLQHHFRKAVLDYHQRVNGSVNREEVAQLRDAFHDLMGMVICQVSAEDQQSFMAQVEQNYDYCKLQGKAAEMKDELQRMHLQGAAMEQQLQLMKLKEGKLEELPSLEVLLTSQPGLVEKYLGPLQADSIDAQLLKDLPDDEVVEMCKHFKMTYGDTIRFKSAVSKLKK